jgi:hypothetical protein
LLAKLETYHKDGQCMFGVFGFPGFFETGDSAIDAAMALDVTKRDPNGALSNSTEHLPRAAGAPSETER